MYHNQMVPPSSDQMMIHLEETLIDLTGEQMATLLNETLEVVGNPQMEVEMETVHPTEITLPPQTQMPDRETMKPHY